MTVPAATLPAVATVDEISSALKRNGVRYLFGIPGGGSSIDLIEACRRVEVPFVLVQHETTAAMMAAVAGELTGTCGACISIMGPGATNLAAGASFAYLERHALLCFTETYGTAQAPLTSMQNIDHAATFGPFSKASITISPSAPGQQIDRAIRLAMAERPGPVHVDLPMDVMATSTLAADAPEGEATARNIEGDLEAIANAINKAKRPLMIVGPVVRRQNAQAAALQIAEKLQMAVMATSKARGVVPEDHPLFAGVISGVYARPTFEADMVARSDLIVAVGLDRVELLSPWSHTQPIVTLDAINVPEEETVGEPVLKASGPLPELLWSVDASLRIRTTWDSSKLQTFWDAAFVTLGTGDTDLNAASAIKRARDLAPRDAILTTEAGVYGRVNLYVWKVYDPLTYFDSSGANSMGFSIPAALAAAMVRPEQKAIAFVGDGGFLMRAGELETAARLGLAPVMVVFDDGTLGMIRIKQRQKEYTREGVDMAQTDFSRLAESFGAVGHKVRTLEEFDAAFKTALDSDRMTVIDARLDPDVYAAHIPPIRGG